MAPRIEQKDTTRRPFPVSVPVLAEESDDPPSHKCRRSARNVKHKCFVPNGLDRARATKTDRELRLSKYRSIRLVSRVATTRSVSPRRATLLHPATFHTPRIIAPCFDPRYFRHEISSSPDRQTVFRATRPTGFHAFSLAIFLFPFYVLVRAPFRRGY